MSMREERIKGALQALKLSRTKLEKLNACRELSSSDFLGEYVVWSGLVSKLEDTGVALLIISSYLQVCVLFLKAVSCMPFYEKSLRVLAYQSHMFSRCFRARECISMCCAEKDVRRQVAVGLGLVAKHGDETTMGMLARASSDNDWSVRQAALTSLVSLDCGKKDDPMWRPAQANTLEAVRKAMSDEQPEVRRTATQLLGQCAKRGDAFAITCLLQASTSSICPFLCVHAGHILLSLLPSNT